MIRGSAVLGPLVQSGLLFIFFKGKEIYLFSLVSSVLTSYLMQTQSLHFFAPRTLSAPYYKVCKMNLVFFFHILTHHPSPDSVLLHGSCL